MRPAGAPGWGRAIIGAARLLSTVCRPAIVRRCERTIASPPAAKTANAAETPAGIFKDLAMPFQITRKELAWALYDWGNSAFATAVMASLFPLMLRQHWLPADAAPETGTILLGRTSAVAGLLVAGIAPLAGAIGDRRGNRCRLLFAFALFGIAGTIALATAPAGNPLPAIIAFVIATIGFAGANAFYDSLLISVTSRDRFDFISGFGFSLGYLGGGILFTVVVFALAAPERFGLSDATGAAKAAFVLVGVWWFVFTLPLIFSVRDKVDANAKVSDAVIAGVKQLAHTFADVRRNKAVFVFLLAYFFYIDGVNTVMKMACDLIMYLNEATSGKCIVAHVVDECSIHIIPIETLLNSECRIPGLLFHVLMPFCI